MIRGTVICSLGTLLAGVGLAGLALAAPEKTPSKSPILDPSHILCGEQFKPDPRAQATPLKQCTDAAATFYKEEWQPQVQALLAGDPKGLEALRAATTFELPDGSMISGSSMPAYVPALLGANVAQLTAISDDFTFKPIDGETVMVFGLPKFTIKGRDGTTYVVTSAQLSMYRRTHNGTPPRGWEELGEFWTYQAATKGPKPTPPPVVPGSPLPAGKPTK